jgi:hypothetical protein
MLIVQALALLGLTVYCIETYKLRSVSQKQLQTSLDQVEGLSKPCITFLARLREGAEVVLDMHGAVGNLIVRPNEGSYVITNLGNGLALNLRYYFTRDDKWADQRDWRYVPAIPASAKVALVETLNFYDGEHEAVFEYTSIGGRNYRSTIALNNHVITSFRFEEINQGAGQ